MGGHESFEPSEWLDLVMILGVFSLQPLALLWITLGRRRFAARMLVLVAGSITMLGLLSKITDSDWEILLEAAVYPACWLVATLLLVRWSGYRLFWRGETEL
jgi:hypothetical protein